MIPPDSYNLGSASSGNYLIQISDLKNAAISGYGAQLSMTTTAQVMLAILGFTNPSNVTVAGLSFTDYGTNLNVNWQGAVCISIDTTINVSKFKMVDIVADKVLSLVRSMLGTYYTGTEFDISGTVKNSYYGLTAQYTGRFSKANITA